MKARRFALASLTTDEVRAITKHPPTAVLVPVGSVEPHGPHLPLGTDTLISDEAAERAAVLLQERGVSTYVAPAVPYGVTLYAAGFSGAISVPADALTRMLNAIAVGLLGDGWGHACFVNNHLEPAHVLVERIARLFEDRLGAYPLDEREQRGPIDAGPVDGVQVEKGIGQGDAGLEVGERGRAQRIGAGAEGEAFEHAAILRDEYEIVFADRQMIELEGLAVVREVRKVNTDAVMLDGNGVGERSIDVSVEAAGGRRVGRGVNPSGLPEGRGRKKSEEQAEPFHGFNAHRLLSPASWSLG